MKSTTRQDYLDRICRVLHFVQEHLDEDLSPAILSDVANLSVYHFHRVFSGLVGGVMTARISRVLRNAFFSGLRALWVSFRVLRVICFVSGDVGSAGLQACQEQRTSDFDFIYIKVKMP
jgi:AraC-like DNA-binding protein